MSLNIIEYSELTPELAKRGVFVKDMPEDAYHSHDSVSKSMLDLVNQSPAHVHSKEFKKTEAMRIGTAVHCAVLEPSLFEKNYYYLEGVITKAAKDYKNAQELYSDVLLDPDMKIIRGIEKAICDNDLAHELMSTKGVTELSAFVECPETGLILRCRYDKLIPRMAIDLKTTKDATSRGFTKSIAQYRYHVQAFHYSRVYELITGHKLDGFKFIAVEKTAPYLCGVYWLDDLSLKQAEIEYFENLKKFATCKHENNWDAESEDGMVSLPDWAFTHLEAH